MHRSLPRLVATTRPLLHENPLGLPRSGTPPTWGRLPKHRPIRGVKHVVAVSSAKGGVGKSTVAANLAVAFSRLGLRAGLLDVDIFGPSVPTMFSLTGEPRLSKDNQLVPMTAFGVQTMSMGYLMPPESAVVWRGPMVMKAVQQLLHEVAWDGVDVLVMDLPPGTGDTQLTIAQQIVMDGAVIVSTPHTLAVADAVRGVAMFKKTDTKVLGFVQNMSVFTCPHCDGETRVFGSEEGAAEICAKHDMQFLGDIPLDAGIGRDVGKPSVAAGGKKAEVFMHLARKVGGIIGVEMDS